MARTDFLVLVLASAGFAPSLAFPQSSLLEPTRRMLPRPGGETWGQQGFAITDHDGDGRSDVFVATHAGIELWLGTPSGRLIRSGPPIPGTASHRLALLDLEGDGDLDLHWGGYGMLRNDGGSFTDLGSILPFSVHAVLSVAAGDFDGDGDDDILRGLGCPPFGCFPVDVDVLLRNDGSGNFTSDATAFPAGLVGPTYRLLVADLDLDGDLDPIPNDQIFHNDGSGHFAHAGSINTYWYGNGIVFDRDLDGDPDAIFAPGNPLYDPFLFDNDGAGHLLPVVGAFSGLKTDAVGVAELDGDGYPDVVVDQYSGKLRVFHNDGAGLFVDAGEVEGPDGINDADDIAAIDVDLDGDEDLLLFSYTGVKLFVSDGAGTLYDRTRSMPWRAGEASPVLLDHDGDGDLDLASDHNLYDNDGSGQLRDLIDGGDYTEQPHWLAGELAAFDLDGDGDPDLVDGMSGSTTRVYWNGGGSFQAGFEFLESYSISAVEVTDFNDDGFGDVAIGYSYKPDDLYLGMPGGAFAQQPSPFADARTGDLAAADLDGDGDVDLYTAHTGPGSNPDAIHLNSGGVLAPGGTLPSVTQEPTSAVEHGDVDLDGDLDLVLGLGWSNSKRRNVLLLNDGAAGFTDAGAFPNVLDTTLEVVLADFDVDGRLDVVFLNDREPNRFLRGLGGATFVEQSDRIPPYEFAPGRAAAGDLDGDGDLELVLGGDRVVEVWTGMRRQLAWGAVPRIGYPTPMLLSGSPNAPWWLAWAPLAAQAPLPPLGTLFLDPSSLQILATGLLDGDGRAAHPVVVPDAPALIGVSVYAQALIGNPTFLANLEIVKIEAF